MTQSEILQSAWKQYEDAHDHIAASARDAVTWALDNGLVTLPRIDPVSVLAGQMSRALREEYQTDILGRRYRVNHAVRVSKDGVQLTLWGQLDFQSRPFMEMAFTQRREQVVGDCFQLKMDIDVWNDKHPQEVPIQMEMDFTEDVAEREMAMAYDDD